jgi:hypothetical protein
LLALEKRLPDILAGKAQPVHVEDQIAFAAICGLTKRYQTAARLYVLAFARDPRQANLNTAPRYHAARYAALAAARAGCDAPTLGDQDRALWRRQALTWLRAELTARDKQLQSWWPGQAAQARQALLYWQKDAGLASLRDKDALAQLPLEERQACQGLWADVQTLLAKAQPKTK